VVPSSPRSSEEGGEFKPHINACFLQINDCARIVFTDALVGGWRPSDHPFMTAIITLPDHQLGTEYVASALHRSAADRRNHEDMGFCEGWRTITEQLAELAERRAKGSR
jgi:uncharacterized protein YndB with AHSA1/START domain